MFLLIVTRHTKTHKPKAPVVTVTDAARLLGVTREHLSRVLHGHRESRRLMRQYGELCEQKGNQ